jgi:glycosyltransferase involved in cell wall biosynthesis
MTNVTIEDENVLLPVVTTLIIRNNNNIINTLTSFKEVSNTFVVFSLDQDTTTVTNFCDEHDITLHLQVKNDVVDDNLRNELIKYTDSILIENKEKVDKYVLLIDEGDELKTPKEFIKFIQDNRRSVPAYAIKCQYPFGVGSINIKMIKSHRGLRYKNGMINLIQIKNQQMKDVHIIDNITIQQQWNKSLVALVMMVKNEKLRLEYSFNSVKDFTDTFIILDTGSTDNTMDICKEYCAKHNIKLFLKEEPFINFEVTRNASLDWADEALTTKNKEMVEKKDQRYLLFLDCNDELKSGQELLNFVHNYRGTGTGFFLKQQWWTGNKFDSYFNIRMVKSHCGWRYKGVVHEYIKTPIKEYDVKERLDSVILYQDRTSDDDKSLKRFNRDKDMLFNAYLKNPSEPRTLFYLAQTCGCLTLPNEAYQYYLMRVKYDGFLEEVFHSYLRLGELSMVLGHPWEESQSWFLKAFAHSARAEPLVHLTKRYMEYNTMNERKPDYYMAYMYSSMACKLTYPTNQVLFIDKKVYNLDRWRSLAKCAYHVQQYRDGKEAIIRALMYGRGNKAKPVDESTITLENYKQRLDSMNEKGKPTEWHLDMKLLIDYLKMDKEINEAISHGGVPAFKTLTYIVNDKVTLTPLEESTTFEHDFNRNEILKEGLSRLLKK